jgi:phosphoribosylanthranilate isomerase
VTRTRIKICGLTRADDVLSAVGAGADAIGFVFYPESPRAVTARQAATLATLVPPFVTRVGLFVNEDPATVRNLMAVAPIELLQFHGDEDDAYCSQFRKPFIKAARVKPGVDLVKFAHSFPSAQALLLDAFVEGYGGGGKPFDWGLIPSSLSLPVVLSGGLQPENVGAAIRSVKPWAVDVSSGVESAKGIKDPTKIAAFIAAVKNADV